MTCCKFFITLLLAMPLCGGAEAQQADVEGRAGFRVERILRYKGLEAFTWDDRGQTWVVSSSGQRTIVSTLGPNDGEIQPLRSFQKLGNRTPGILVSGTSSFISDGPAIRSFRTNGSSAEDRVHVPPPSLFPEHLQISSLTWSPLGYIYFLYHSALEGNNGIGRVDLQGRNWDVVAKGTFSNLSFDANGFVIAADAASEKVFRVAPGLDYDRGLETYTKSDLALRIDKSKFSASFATIYFGSAWPQENRGTWLLLNRARSTVEQFREEDNALKHWRTIAHADQSTFRNLQVGPDGAAWLLVEPRNDDEEKGFSALYRLAAPDFAGDAPARKEMSTLNNDKLVAEFGSANSWRRDAALRILDQREELRTARGLHPGTPLHDAVREKTNSAMARVYAVLSLHRLGLLDETMLENVADDEEPLVRTWGVLLFGERNYPTGSAFQKMIKLAKDTNAMARAASAIAARQFVSGSLAIDTPPRTIPIREVFTGGVLSTLWFSTEKGSTPEFDLLYWNAVRPITAFDPAHPMGFFNGDKDSKLAIAHWIVGLITRQIAETEDPLKQEEAMEMLSELKPENPRMIIAALRGLKKGTPNRKAAPTQRSLQVLTDFAKSTNSEIASISEEIRREWERPFKISMKRLKAFCSAAILATLMFPAGAQTNGHIPGAVVARGNNLSGQSTVPGELNRVAAIAAGEYHSLALKADGTVVAWGYNDRGQTAVPAGLTGVAAIAAGENHSLGLKADGAVVGWGDDSQLSVPVGLSGVVAIAAGGVHSLALKSDGTVVAWGSNGTGQSAVPSGLRDVAAIAAGHFHSLALKSDGTVVAWGKNDYGQSTVPSGLTGVVAVAAGTYHSLALKSDGTVVAWGHNNSGQSAVPGSLRDVAAIAAGASYNLALRSDGTVVAWGRNEYGETDVPPGLIGVVAVAAGVFHSLALKSDGTIVGWGSNGTGQLPQPLLWIQPLSQALAVEETAHLSVTVSGFPPSYQWRKDGIDIIGATNAVYSISHVRTNDSGSYSVIITNASGSVTSSNAVLTVAPILITQQPQNRPVRWVGTAIRFNVTATGAEPLSYQWYKDGTKISGATGSAYSRPITQSSDAGSYSVLITNRHGSITSSNAELTVAVAPNPLATRTPGRVVSWGGEDQSTVPDGLGKVVAIAAGGSQSLALRSDGTITAWGGGTTPEGLGGVVAIAAGVFHGLALKYDGTVVGWGFNGFTGAVPDGLSNVTAIAACGDYGDSWGAHKEGYNLALRADRTVAGWGDPSYGVVPAGLSNVIAIATGGAMSPETWGHMIGHSLALKADGTVVGWGSDWFDDNGHSLPEGLSGVVAIATGSFHSLALKFGGTVVAWGDNNWGQIDVPNGLTNVVAIAAGLHHSLALKSDGTVVGWGYETEGAMAIPGGLTGVVAIAAGDYHSLALIADAPDLTVQASGENISLSWPLWAQGFMLQSATNLADQSSWTPVLTVPGVEASQNHVADPISGPARFYRLRK